MEGDKPIDEIISYFGMRNFCIESDKTGIKRLLLNNQPIFQNGLLDQGFWPDGLYTAPTDEETEINGLLTYDRGIGKFYKVPSTCKLHQNKSIFFM